MLATILIWIIGTLALLTISVFLAKKGGPEYIIGLFAALYVASNVLASKIVQFGPFTVAGGIIAFSVTFYLTDMLSEVYGKKEAQKAFWVGLLAQVFFIVLTWIAIKWPAAPFWENQDAFVSILGLSGRIAIASILTYLVSQSHDIWAYDFWRRKTKGKYLWLRNNASTFVSQVMDSIIFGFLAFYGVLPLPALWQIIIGGIIAKLIIAIFDTPFLYAVKWYFNKK